MDGSFMDILRKKKESRFTRNNLSDGKQKLLDSKPSFDVEFPEYSFPDNKEELPQVIKAMKEKKIPESQMEDLDKNNNDLMLDIVNEKRSDWIELIKDIDIYTIRLKMKYARPRPYEISEEIESTTDTDDSPSFPSGHAIEAHALAVILGDKFPDKKEKLTKMADKISLSRLQMGNHYPSDIEVGEKVGKLIADAYLEKNVKKSMTIHKSDADTVRFIDSLEDKVKPLAELINLYSKSTEKDPLEDDTSISQVLEDFLKIYESNINQVTNLVRGLTTRTGKVKPEKMARAFGGRLLPVFTEITEEINPRTKEKVLAIRRYNGKDADKIYLEIIRAIPGLSTLGGSISRNKYTKLVNHVKALRAGALDSASMSKMLIDRIRKKEYSFDEFNEIEDELLDMFTEVSIDVSDYKDAEEDLGLESSEVYYKEIFGEDVSSAYDKFVSSLFDSLRFLDRAFTYVRGLLSKLESGVEELDSETLFEERTKDMTEEDRQRLARPTGMSIDLDAFREAFGDDFKQGSDDDIRQVRQALKMMEDLVDDFDNHEFILDDKKSRVRVNIAGKGKNLITSDIDKE